MNVFLSQRKCLTVMILVHLLIAKLPMQGNISRKEKLKKKKKRWGQGEEKEKKAGDVKAVLIIIL